MSKEEENRPVIEVTEESWEEDTSDVDVFELEDTLSPPDSEVDSVPSGTADTRRSTQLEKETQFESAPVDAGSGMSEPIPQDGSLPESLAPVAPLASAVPPYQRATPFSAIPTDSEPPPSRASGFPPTSEPPRSLGEQFARARRIGTGIWYAGVFLWTYLVVGELVVSLELPEFFGWSAFAGVVVGAFLHGANRIGTLAMRTVAAISVGSVIAGIFFLVTVVGSSHKVEYQTVSLLLLIASVGLILWGIRFSHGGLPRPLGPSGIKWPRLLLWLFFVGQTAFTVAQYPL